MIFETTSSLKPIRVLLADDHDILRQGLTLLLGLQPEILVVGEARTGREAVTQVDRLAPHVVVMDISMPDMDGLEACRTIRAQTPTTHVLILTMHDNEGYFLQALRAGAAGYIVKKAAPTELHTAISAVAQGGVFLYPGLAKTLVHAYLTQSSSPLPARAEEGPNLAQELKVLTPRELEIVTLVAEGYTNQAIADRLTLSIKTVQSHRANVMEKLGLRDITQLVRFALRHRLIDTEP
ncbi:MAG TPA: response regulator transcription factor [Ktedonobacteraceae bacterium]|jgi:DNA-binding NarL/FixJ family response regulator|nr:response regulator transcription factor [Ktedonobacteraceae bacterium]